MAKKNLVNWSDCMPLSAAIFNQHDDYFLDSIRDSIEPTVITTGCCPPDKTGMGRTVSASAST